MRIPVQHLICLAAIALLALVAGCEGGAGDPSPTLRSAPSGEVEPPRPNIVLVTIDTLRADHVSAYGYDKKTTPFLDAVARQSIRFERAYSTASWTLPAIVSLLTGLDPESHGIQRGAVGPTGKIVYQDVLSDEHDLLSERLRRAGYQTIGITANAHLRAQYGFGQGFDVYECIGFEDAFELHAAIEELLPRIDRARPWFLWVHYFDPHAPYRAQRGLLGEYLAGAELDARLVDRLQQLIRPEQFEEMGIHEDAKVLQHTLALYDAEIRNVDRHVKSLFDDLGIGEDALVIVASDHGEEFLDHGDLWHGHTLFEELIRVPLILRLPRGRGGGTVRTTPVSLVDVVPTLIDYLELDSSQPLQGHSLMALIDGEATEARPVHASLALERSIESIAAGGFKYVHDPQSPAASLLFDLERDPAERENLLHTRPEKAEELRLLLLGLVERARAERIEPASVTIDEESLDELRSLGYLN